MKIKIITLVVLVLFATVNIVALDISTLKSLRKKENVVDGVTWLKFKSKKTPISNFKVGTEMHDYDNSMFYLYIGVKEEKEAFLRMYVQLEPVDQWINFNKIAIFADGETFEREFNIKMLNTTVGIRQQYIEFYDVEVMPHEVKMFEKIATAKDVIITFKGGDKSQDLKFKKKHKQAIKEVLDAWKKLNS